MPTVPNIPWESEVGDDDPCQVVKEQETKDTVLVKCKGRCVRGTCMLQKRDVGGDREKAWQAADEPEAAAADDTRTEYRCICT